jgi:hypothetical protein
MGKRERDHLEAKPPFFKGTCETGYFTPTHSLSLGASHRAIKKE